MLLSYFSRVIQNAIADSPRLLINANAPICCTATMGSLKPIGASRTPACSTLSTMQAHEYALADWV